MLAREGCFSMVNPTEKLHTASKRLKAMLIGLIILWLYLVYDSRPLRNQQQPSALAPGCFGMRRTGSSLTGRCMPKQHERPSGRGLLRGCKVPSPEIAAGPRPDGISSSSPLPPNSRTSTHPTGTLIAPPRAPRPDFRVSRTMPLAMAHRKGLTVRLFGEMRCINALCRTPRPQPHRQQQHQ